MESNYIAVRSTLAREGDALYSPDGYLGVCQESNPGYRRRMKMVLDEVT